MALKTAVADGPQNGIAVEDLNIDNMTKRGRRAAPESSDSETHAVGVTPRAMDTPVSGSKQVLTRSGTGNPPRDGHPILQW